MSKRVFKYPTGVDIPEEAIYLSTQVEKHVVVNDSQTVDTHMQEQNLFVWHYFLVEVGSDKQEDGGST
jgi:translation elongation factor EF-Ts